MTKCCYTIKSCDMLMSFTYYCETEMFDSRNKQSPSLCLGCFFYRCKHAYRNNLMPLFHAFAIMCIHTNIKGVSLSNVGEATHYQSLFQRALRPLPFPPPLPPPLPFPPPLPLPPPNPLPRDLLGSQESRAPSPTWRTLIISCIKVESENNILD